ncbi:MAG: aminopeptidase P family protein [Chitinophagales bacterium]|nr:aminopeptidase P family protein [Chitinophagales bacterium]
MQLSSFHNSITFVSNYIPMRYSSISADLFVLNRSNYTKKLQKQSIAVFVSNDIVTRSADASYKWRQNPDLFYLTGIDQEETYLILFPDAPDEKYREILFVRKTSELVMWWEGRKHTKQEASDLSGIKNVMWSDQFESTLGMLMHYAQHVYLNTNEHDRSISMNDATELKFARELMHKFPLHKYERSAPLMHELRLVKSKWEVELLKQAMDITRKGFIRALKFIKPGVWEYEIEAELTHEYVINRGSGHAYEPIVATGENACVLHYVTNNAQCQEGELVLMDCAAEYANYNADLTRTVPVSGKFTKRQKAVYNAVLRVHREARDMMKAGVVLDELNKEVGKFMESELIQLRLLKKSEVNKQSKDNPLYKKYFPHGTAHFLGLDVHDVGNRFGKLKAGAVLTCEPGIYIREEKLGIRIENNILVTNGKPVDLMANIPIEAEEIEEIMNSK